MAFRQDPADVEAFKRIKKIDSENNFCFSCGYPQPTWCDVSHGTFICMQCSGAHRELGVHLSFVRSSTMDNWTTWKPEKLRQMEIGGNKRARLFFEQKNVPKTTLKERYESEGALMYTSKLEKEAQGLPFNELTWTPPQWKIDKTNREKFYSPIENRNSADLYTGITSSHFQDEQNFSYMKSSWNIDNQNKKAKEKGIEGADHGWGKLTSFLSNVNKVVSEATKNTIKEYKKRHEDNGLEVLTQNIERSEGLPPKYLGIGNCSYSTKNQINQSERSVLNKATNRKSESDFLQQSDGQRNFIVKKHLVEEKKSEAGILNFNCISPMPHSSQQEISPNFDFHNSETGSSDWKKTNYEQKKKENNSWSDDDWE